MGTVRSLARAAVVYGLAATSAAAGTAWAFSYRSPLYAERVAADRGAAGLDVWRGRLTVRWGPPGPLRNWWGLAAPGTHGGLGGPPGPGPRWAGVGGGWSTMIAGPRRRLPTPPSQLVFGPAPPEREWSDPAQETWRVWIGYGFERSFEYVEFGGGPAAVMWHQLLVPRWFILLAVLGGLGPTALRVGKRYRRRAAARAGRCPASGYDLRASPGRCPGCGAEPKGASA